MIGTSGRGVNWGTPFNQILLNCSLSKYIDSTDRGLIWYNINPRSVLDLFHPNFIGICCDAIVCDIF